MTDRAPQGYFARGADEGMRDRRSPWRDMTPGEWDAAAESYRRVTQVMRDIAKIGDEFGQYTFAKPDDWTDIIDELTELSAEDYAKALEGHRTLARIANSLP